MALGATKSSDNSLRKWRVYFVSFVVSGGQEGLSARVALVAANKMDLPEAEGGLAELRRGTPLPVAPISAKRGEGLVELMLRLHAFGAPY